MYSVCDLLSLEIRGLVLQILHYIDLELTRMRSALGFGITFKPGRPMGKNQDPPAPQTQKGQLGLLEDDRVRRHSQITGQQGLK